MKLLIKYIIFVLVLLHNSISYSASFNEYAEALSDELLGYKKYSFSSSPDFLARFVFCGEQIDPSYTKSITIEDNILSKEIFSARLIKIIEPIDRILRAGLPKITTPEDIKEIFTKSSIGKGMHYQAKKAPTALKIIYPNVNRDIKNCFDKMTEAVRQDSDFTFAIFIEPRKVENYQNAANYLYSGLFSSLSTPQQFIELLLHTHAILCKDLVSDDGITAIPISKYRNASAVVLPDEDDEHYKAEIFLDKTLQKKAYHLKQEGNLPDFNNEEELYDFLLEKLTAKEIRELAINNVYITASYKDIRTLLTKFATKFIEGCKLVDEGRLNPIAFSAWAHAEFIYIHPFFDANGRTARLLLNAILMHWHYPPVIIKNDKEYSKIIRQDIKQKGIFTKYISEMIIWTDKQLNDNNIGLLDLPKIYDL
jgi:hypothetical protein